MPAINLDFLNRSKHLLLDISSVGILVITSKGIYGAYTIPGRNCIPLTPTNGTELDFIFGATSNPKSPLKNDLRLFILKLVERKGFEPFLQPCKDHVLPLSLTPHKMVPDDGLEPPTYAM